MLQRVEHGCPPPPKSSILKRAQNIITTQRLQSSSFLVMTYSLLRDYNIQPTKELLWSLWVYSTSICYPVWLAAAMAYKPSSTCFANARRLFGAGGRSAFVESAAQAAILQGPHTRSKQWIGISHLNIWPVCRWTCADVAATPWAACKKTAMVRNLEQ